MQKQNKSTSKWARLSAAILAVTLLALFGVASIVHADKYDDQINALRVQNNSVQGQLNGLTSQASSYQDAINQLRYQINSVEAQISANQVQQNDLQTQIAANQAIIDAKKISLAATIKAMYIDGQITTIEQLATSKNLSDYIDKEEYRSVVQSKLNATIKEIAALQAALQSQKLQVETLIIAEKTQNDQLAASQAAQAALLAYNQAQQDGFNGQLIANKAQITKLQQAQFAEYRAHYGNGIVYGGTGGYPYSNAHTLNGGTYCWGYNNDGSNGCTPANEYDPAGWSYRNCTGYAFWRLNQARGISLPAGNFPSVMYSGGKIGYSIPDFKNLGYTVDHNSSGATLAIEGAGPYGPGSYGHIMYIEGSYVSQYNALGDGLFSTAPIPSANFWFVHIP